MTSINALKFDFYSGAMICDEQRHWNQERMKIYAADKIRSVVAPYLREKYHIAAAYGNTGTSTIGDELRLTIFREVENFYQKSLIESSRDPENFMTIADIARLAWNVICRLKHKHVDDALRTKYGFSTAELIQGFMKAGRTKITNDQIIKDAIDSIAPDPAKPAADAVFGNAGIIAGCDRVNGFQIFNVSMSLGLIEPVESGYVALGSGGDTTNFVIPRFLNRTGVNGRIEGIDRVEGIFALIDAVNMASEHNLGVGGYFNILLFDSRSDEPEEFYKEISDHRSKLACETVKAARAGFISYKTGCRIVEQLLFHNESTNIAEQMLWDESCNKRALHRLLRGYPVISNS